MKSHSNMLLSLVATAAFSLFPIQAMALGLGTAGQFNTFVFEDFVGTNTDTEGKLAVGGNATLTNYDVGLKASNTSNVLVVGNNLNYTNGEIRGDAVVGGKITSTGATFKGTTLQNQSTLPVDFVAEEVYLKELSKNLTDIIANGTTKTTSWGEVQLVGDKTSKLQVFDINGSDLSKTNTLNLDKNSIAQDATIVFNVSGDVSGFNNMGMWALDSIKNKVLFNFYEAKNVNIGSVAVLGSILAPTAQINTTAGAVIWGSTIAKSWAGSAQQNMPNAQQNHVPFTGELPTPVPTPVITQPPVNVTPVPEPTTLLLLGLGVLGLAAVARKKRQ